MSEPRLELKRLEYPEFELVSNRVEEPDPADLFELIIKDGNGGFVTYSATRDKMRNVLIKILHQLERY